MLRPLQRDLPYLPYLRLTSVGQGLISLYRELRATPPTRERERVRGTLQRTSGSGVIYMLVAGLPSLDEERLTRCFVRSDADDSLDSGRLDLNE